jgi:hypothetical protein
LKPSHANAYRPTSASHRAPDGPAINVQHRHQLGGVQIATVKNQRLLERRLDGV